MEASKINSTAFPSSSATASAGVQLLEGTGFTQRWGIAVIILIVSSVVYHRFFTSAPLKPLPPGPKALPIIGNLHQHPTELQWKQYKAWHNQYGPLISLKLAGFNVIIIGSHKVANDLLDKRGLIYSTRPRMIYANECMTNGLQPGLQPYNDNWKRLHRIETVFLNPTALKSYSKFHELESCSLVHNLLTVGDDCSGIITKFTQGVAFTLALGKRMSPENEPEFLELGEFAARKSTGFHWAAFLVDIFPSMNCLPAPLAPWKRLGKQMFDEEIHLMGGVVKAALATGNWSWSEELMRQKEKEGISWNQVCYIVGELMIGAYLSSNATMHLLITTATLFPECIRKAQAQLDEVVGMDRLPSVADEDQLPYIVAFINETLRWRPVAPLGMLHAVSKDDEYMGYRIPKNSVIVTNQWGLERDDEVHKDPEAFRPERWIENPDLPLAGFGFGRRKCPGNKFSQRSLYMGLSRCLWAYDILPPAGFDRKAELLNIASKGGTFPSLAPPTKAVFKIRSPKHREVIKQSWLNIDKDENQMFADIGAKVSK